MGKALRAVIATAFLGLTLASTAAADTSTTDFFIARDDCGGDVPPNLRLDLDPGPYSGSCGNLAAILGGSTDAFPAKTGVPITIDGTRNAAIYIGVDPFQAPVGGIGDQTIAVELVGRSSTNARVVMAQGSQTVPAAEMLRKGSYVAEFDLPVVGGFYKAMTLNLTVGGSELHGFVNYGGASAVVLPVPDPV